jgi:hypothetical protein
MRSISRNTTIKKMFMNKLIAKLLLGVLFVLGNVSMYAQSTANYTSPPTASATLATGSLALDMNGNTVDMTTGTSLSQSGGVDDSPSGIFNIGFDFWMYGNRFTQFSTTSNGLVALGSSILSGTVYTPAGGTTTTPILAALGGDLYVGAAGKIHYKVVGTSPNRCLVIEFNTMAVTYSTSAADAVSTYQVRLYETTGVIEFVYGAMVRTAGTAGGDVCATGFSVGSVANTTASVTTSTNTTNNGATFNTNTYAVSSGAITNLNSAANGSRRIYRFTPPGTAGHATITSLAAPTGPLTFSSITTTGMTVNWTAASPITGIVKYAVYYSSDGGTTYTFANSTNVGTSTLAITGLTPGITYTIKVVSVSEGTLGGATTGTQATAAAATYYYVGAATGSDFSTAASWNTNPAGGGTTRTTPLTTDILIIDGIGTANTAGGITIAMGAPQSLGALQITNSTAVTLQSSTTTTRTLTLTGSAGDELSVPSGSSLILNNATQAATIVFLTGIGMTGTIAGTLTFGGSTSNTLTTTGGTNTVVTVTATGVVNLGAAGNTLVGSAATLIIQNSATVNSNGATTGAPPVPLATWGASSNLIVTGLTTSSTGPTNNAQSFGNLTYNCPSSSGTISWFTTSTTAVIQGDLTITATGTGIFRALTTGTLNVTGNVFANGGTLQSASGAGTFIVSGNTTIGASGKIDINAGTYSQRGTTFTNNGVLTGVSGTSTLGFVSFSNTPQTYTGTGTVLTNVGVISLQNGGGLTISTTNPTPVLRVNLFIGTITGSNLITIGTGAALATTVQIGSTGLVTPGGSFATAPVFNLGTGTYTILYQYETAPRTTGFEIPATRTVNFVTVGNPNNVTVSGGALGIGTLTLQSGNLITSAANLVTITGTTTTSTVRSTYTSAAGATSSGTTITVTSTSGLLAGMNISVSAGVGSFPAGTTVSSVTNTTTFVASAAPTTPLSGGASVISGIGGWVSGPLAITLPASLVTGSTYSIPVGKSIYNAYDLVNPTTNAGGTVVLQAEAFDANAGGTAGVNMSALNTNKYWAASINSGAGNFTNTFIKLTDQTSGAIVSSSAIATSATQTGSYDLVGGTSPTVVVGTSVTTTTTASTTISGFYILGLKSVNMAYVSSTTTQAVTSAIIKPATNQQIIGVQIVTLGNANPLTLTGMTFNTTGCTAPGADISNARVWYTGNSSTFATTTQFGSDVPTPSGSYTIPGSQVLAEGTNYFWLVYDVPSGATVNDVLDAECTSVNVGGAQTPSVTAPAGTRTIKAPLAGTYLVGTSQTAPNYAKLTDAIADLNLYGVSAAVVFQLQSDYSSATETFPLTINTITGGSATNTLTIKPGTGVTASISGSGATAMFVLNGADYVTIDGSNGTGTNTICPTVTATRDLSITNTSTSSSAAIIHIASASASNGATNNVIKNCVLSGSSSTTTGYGVDMGGATVSSVALTANSNNTIQNNKVSKVQIGINLLGTSTSTLDVGNTVSLNNLGSATAGDGFNVIGIQVDYQDGLRILNNDIQNIVTSVASNIEGLNLFDHKNSIIDKNKVHFISYTGSSTLKIYAINTTNASFNASGAQALNLFSNNMVYNIISSATSSTWNVSGINTNSGYNDKFYNNTVYLTGQMNASGSGPSAAFCNGNASNLTFSTNIDVKNNIFHINATSPGAATFYSHFTLNTSNTGLSLNNNDLICVAAGSATAKIGRINAVDYATLALWQGAGAANEGAASINIAPVYLSDPHIDPTAGANLSLNGAATPLGSVPSDIDCDTRDITTPDIGADEFTPPSCTGAVGGTGSGSASFCTSGTPTITASGYSTGTGSTYQWQYSNDNFVSDIHDFVGQTNPSALTTGVVSVTTYYRLKVTCTSGLATDYSTTVTITINPSAAIISGSTSKCANDPAVTLNETGGTGTSWLWSTGATTQSISVNPSSTTIYTVQVTSPGGCTLTSSSFTLTVNPNPTGVTANASVAAICTGSTINLTSSATAPSSTILTEGFESGAAGWVFTDSSSTGTTLASQVFHIENAPYTDGSGSATFSNFSVTGTKFAYSNPDAGGTGSQTRTFMTSPSFSTVGYTGTGTVSFKHVYRYWSTSSPVEQVKVQITSNGGTTWTDLINYNGGDQGTTTNNAQATTTASLTIPAGFMGQPSVKLRWRYLSNWGYFWIIDDVSVSGTPASYSYAWTSTPAGFNSALQNPTGVAPTVNTDYTVNVTGLGGCSTSASTGVVAVNQPAAITTQPTDANACSGAASGATFTVVASGTSVSYQWQESVNGGAFTNITNGGVYSGATSASLSISDVTGKNGNRYQVVVTGTSACTNTVTSNPKTLTVSNTWVTSGTDAWATSSNWSCNVVPGAGDDVVIPGGGTQPLLPSDITVKNITFSSNATITIGSNTFTVNGAISGSGILTGSSTSNLTLGGAAGTLNFTTGSTSLNNLTLNASSSATLGTALDVYGTIALTTAGLNLNSQHLSLKSNATNTARIANLTGSTLTGASNVTMERWIKLRAGGDGRAYRLLAPTVNTSGSIRANWMEGGMNTAIGTNDDPVPLFGAQITGAGGNANGFDKTASNASSLYTASNAVTPTYTAVAGTGGTLNALTGYFLYVRGDRSMDMQIPLAPNMPTSSTTLRTTGTLVTGTQTAFTNGYTNGGALNLVTNPYPSPIDWSLVRGASTGITNFYTFWDPNFNTRGGFVTVSTTGVASSGLATQFIQSGQAFFVESDGGTPAVSIQEAHKTAGNNNEVFLTPPPPVEGFRTELYFTEPNAYRRVVDGALAVFNNTYSAGVDANDAKEINNWDENIAIAREGKHLAIEGRPVILTKDTLPLFMNNMKQQAYEFEFTPAMFSNPNLKAELIDNFLNTRTLLSVVNPTVVSFTVTADAASKATDRFMVVFGSFSGPLAIDAISIKASQKNGGVQVDWISKTETDMASYEVEKSAFGTTFAKVNTTTAIGNSTTPVSYNWFDANPNMGSNFYRVKAIDRAGHIKYSDIVRVVFGKGEPGIVVYPNPVEGRTFKIDLNNMAKGVYVLNLYNSMGQLVYTEQWQHDGSQATKTISLKGDISKGAYQLQLSGGNGFKTTQTLIKN